MCDKGIIELADAWRYNYKVTCVVKIKLLFSGLILS